MNADLRGLHIDALKAIRSAFDGIPAPCAERDALDYAITELSVAQGQGFVMVPRVPTAAMVHFLATGLESRRTVGEIYAAMLAAAPAQPDGVNHG